LAHKEATHTRKVTKNKNEIGWKIEDKLQHTTKLPMRQYWNIAENFEEDFIIEAFTSDDNPLTPIIEEGWYSDLYGVKSKTKVLFFETLAKKITTNIRLK